jgi:hypothetical protein
VLEMTQYWYRYTLQHLEGRPADSYTVVKHNDLVRDLEQTIADIYAALGLEISPEYAQALEEEVRKARDYTSRHEYAVEDMGFTREQIVLEYQDVFDRFGFETSGEHVE